MRNSVEVRRRAKIANQKKCRNPYLAWIDLANIAQCAWALEYLKKSGRAPRDVPSDNASDYLQQIEPWMDCPESRETEGKMRSAWRHVESRSSSPTGSISLPKETKAMLRGLARRRNKPANKLLQELIEDHSKAIDDLEKEYDRKFEMEIGAAKHSVRMKGSCKEWQEYQYEVKRGELLEEEVKRLENVVRSLISDRVARSAPHLLQQYDMYNRYQRQEFYSLCKFMGVNPLGIEGQILDKLLGPK